MISTAKDYHVFATPTLFLLDRNLEILLRPHSVGQVGAWVDWVLVEGELKGLVLWYISAVLLSSIIKPTIIALTLSVMLLCLPGLCQGLFTMRRAVMRVSTMTIGLGQGRAGMRGNTALMRISLDFIEHGIGKTDITIMFDK